MRRTYAQSEALMERARNVLAGGVSSEFRKAGHPLFYERGEGSRIWDVDGNEYVDFTLSQGPLILGHSHSHVLERVAQASAAGQLFAGQHLLELELAERLQRMIPCAELLRFSLSGSEADHAALRVARAVTGRTKFIRFEGHYHGWFDNVSYNIHAPSLETMGERDQPNAIPWTQGLPPGTTDEFIVLPWNDLDLVERTFAHHGEQIAAVITEPIMCNNGCIEPVPGYLQGLRQLCDRYGSALIFDEVITGFRLGLGGAQAHYGVTPDLAVFAKALASGYPISVLAGKRAWMQPIAEGNVIHAGTMNSNTPTVAAALATLDVLESDALHPRLFALGQMLMTGLREACAESGHHVLIQGPGPMFHMGFTDAPSVSDLRGTVSYDKVKYAAFVAGMHEWGIRLIGRGLWYLSAAHTEQDIACAVKAARAVLAEISP